MCVITAGKDSSEVLDVGKEYGLAIPPAASDFQPLKVNDPHIKYAMHFDRPLAFLHQFLRKIDVLVLNTGHHWNREKLRTNKWGSCMLWVCLTPSGR
ncbi:hypothetical protein DITRI_Ditri03aG0044800 [Diplodiscus trichospermus]